MDPLDFFLLPFFFPSFCHCMLNTLSMAMMYSTWLNRSNDEKYNNSTITAPKKKKKEFILARLYVTTTPPEL